MGDTKYEVMARFIWAGDFVVSTLGAHSFWLQLSKKKKLVVVEAVNEILHAPFGTHSGNPISLGLYRPNTEEDDNGLNANGH